MDSIVHRVTLWGAIARPWRSASATAPQALMTNYLQTLYRGIGAGF